MRQAPEAGREVVGDRNQGESSLGGCVGCRELSQILNEMVETLFSLGAWPRFDD